MAGDTEFFSPYEEELEVTRLDRFVGVRPKEWVQRHTAEHSVDDSPYVQTLNAPMPADGEPVRGGLQTLGHRVARAGYRRAQDLTRHYPAA